MSETRSANEELAALVRQRGAESAPEGEPEAGDASTPLLLLRLGEHWFGLRAESVREVVACESVTPVPGQPPHIRGVALIHGRLVSVVALERLLRVLIPERAPAGERTGRDYRRLVVLVEDAGEIAILADDAKGVIDLVLPDSASAADADASASVRGHLVRCEVPWGESLVCVLDGAALVAAATVREET